MLRYVTASVLGAIATIGLLTLMQAVIADPKPAEAAPYQGHLVEWVRLLEDRELVTTKRVEERIPLPDEPPPNPPPPTIVDGGTGHIEITGPRDPTPETDSGFLTFAADGEYLPITRVEPIYPRRALMRGVEGYVLLEFVVTRTGTVRDPVVLVAEPPGYFDRAALNAVLKFKYLPRVVDGVAMDVPGVRARLLFEIDEP
ncbi:MAG: energy transducer TonB [Gammaproteobacteria bacterium]|nr:energy transducer TonB [Gammaproteobacteria bacterium]